MCVKSIGSLVVEGFWPQSMQVHIKNCHGRKLGCRNRELKQVINMAVLVLTGLCDLLICYKSSRRSQLCWQKYQRILELSSVGGFWRWAYKCSKLLVFCISWVWRPSMATGAHPPLGYGVNLALSFLLQSRLPASTSLPYLSLYLLHKALGIFT